MARLLSKGCPESAPAHLLIRASPKNTLFLDQHTWQDDALPAFGVQLCFRMLPSVFRPKTGNLPLPERHLWH